MSDIIVLEGVTKQYRDAEVVSNVSMHVQEGEIYGFLGPNGAGKTTIMKMILNLVKPTMGNIHVFQEPVQNESVAYLRQIGSIIETPVFYSRLSAWENMKLHCAYMGYYDQKKMEETLEMVGLSSCRNKVVSEFSLGMKQRLGIARAIVTRPRLLILDEPINGLDPMGIRQMRELLVSLRDNCGATILISSHIITEIEQIADEIGVLDKGRLLREVSMKEIRKDAVQYIELELDDVQKAATVLDHRFPALNFRVISPSGLRVYGIEDQTLITRALVQENIGILNMSCKNDSLEDYFMDTVIGGGEHA